MEFGAIEFPRLVNPQYCGMKSEVRRVKKIRDVKVFFLQYTSLH